MFSSCSKEIMPNQSHYYDNNGIITRAPIEGTDFDWEHADYMPTHPTQIRIPVPWKGSGSITMTYGIDIAYDFKKIDGWTMLYNSFDPNYEGELTNPYFILYNKYNGILRIYFYLTTDFISPSSYIQDGIAIISNGYSSNLLNFLGNGIIDLNKPNTLTYSQIQGKNNLTAPLATNRWYLLQYELAYDPNLKNVDYKDIQFAWYLNYYNIDEISLYGESHGELEGTIGSSSQNNKTKIETNNDLEKILKDGVLNCIGINPIENAQSNEGNDDKTNLGISKQIIKSISEGIKGGFKGLQSGGIWGALGGVVSGVLSSQKEEVTPIQMTIKTTMNISGVIGSRGSFPSSPTSLYIPGTKDTRVTEETISSKDTTGIIISGGNGGISIVGGNNNTKTLGESLGAVYFKKGATLYTSEWTKQYREIDPYDGWEYDYISNYLRIPKDYDFSEYVIINPDILKDANVTINQQLLCSYDGISYFTCPDDVYIGESGHIDYGSSNRYRLPIHFAVMFKIAITPKTGKEYLIIKTLKINEETK